MAKALGGTQDIRQALTKAPTIQTLWVTRFTIGLGIILCALISLVGTSWDIQWHLFVGRDRTLIPPHLMMLTGITLGGLLALTAVCVETMVVRRKPQLAQYSTQFAGMFYSSLGTYIAGFAALDAFAFVSILAVRLWPLLPILLAPIFDLLINQARRQKWSWRRLHWSSTLLGLLACIPMTIFQLNSALIVANRSGLIGVAAGLLLGLLGTYIGTMLGRQTGENIRQGDASNQASIAG